MVTARDDDVTIYVCSLGVVNAEMNQIAGHHEPWTLQGRNNATYYDEPQYPDTCETVRAIAQGDHAESVDCRISETRSWTPCFIGIWAPTASMRPPT